MGEKTEMTHNQHYVPQVYLRGFSLDNKTVNIFRVDNMEQINNQVPIKSILFEKDVYEALSSKKCEEKYVMPNFIENCMCKLESMFAEYERKLEKKVYYVENLRTKCFLDNEEKDFWRVYIALQMMRSPKVLSVAKRCSEEYLQNEIGKEKADNLALAYCLPFFSKIKAEDDSSAIHTFLPPLLDMGIEVGVLKGGEFLITCDEPVYICAPEWPEKSYSKVIFPVTKNICLFLYGNEEKRNHKKNGLIEIDDDLLYEIIWSIAYRAEHILVSPLKLSAKSLRIVRRARTARKEDDDRISQISK